MNKNQKGPANRLAGFAPILVLGVVVVASVALYFIYKNFGVSRLTLEIPSSSPSVSGTSYEGRYEFCQNELCNYINISPTSNGQTAVDGQAYWNSGSTINTGEIAGNVSIKEDRAYFVEGNCKIDMTFNAQNLVLKERDGSSCGGLNVTFDGNYVKK